MPSLHSTVVTNDLLSETVRLAMGGIRTHVLGTQYQSTGPLYQNLYSLLPEAMNFENEKRFILAWCGTGGGQWQCDQIVRFRQFVKTRSI